MTTPDTLDVNLGEDDGRYHRQTLISWWDQERLARARVLAVGAGALGNELVKNLALLGVGTIVVCDPDVVENSNLSRCIFFRENDEGRPKAEVVAEAASRLNPEIHVVGVAGAVQSALGLGAFADFDLVLGGLDNREARLHVNQACWKVSVPWIDGAIEGLMGVVRSFVPPESACYECTMNEQDYRLLALRRACSLLTREQMLEGKIPTTATSAGVIAAIQAQEAVKLLHADRLGYEFGGQGFMFNGMTHDSYVVRYPRREECLAHDRYDLAGAVRLPPSTTFGELLARGSDALGGPVVLDLEQDVVINVVCARCDTSVPARRLAVDLTVGDVRCPTCRAERRAEAIHTVGADDRVLLGETAKDFGLAPHDVITARRGLARVHFILRGEGAPLESLN